MDMLFINYLIMRKYLLHVIIISFVFFITPTILAASDVERKIEELKQTIRINPDDADAHANLGVAYVKSDMHKEAIEAFKQAIRINSDDADTHNNLGHAYSKSGKYKEATEAFKQAIRIDPDHINAYYNLGLVYNLSNDKNSALSGLILIACLKASVASLYLPDLE